MGEWTEHSLKDLLVLHDKKRIPLSAREREKRVGPYPYYGAASLFGYVDDYIFDGDYILLGEDGTVVTESGHPVLQLIHGKSWVNNHAHVITASKLIDFSFLYYALMNLDVRAAVTGAVQPKISQGSLFSLKMTTPPLPTQRRIAAVLSALDDKIENNRKICANLEAQAQALFCHAKREKNKTNFTTVIDILGGGTPKTSIKEYWGGFVPFFSPKDVGHPYVISTERTITKLGLDNCNSSCYQKDTTFVTARGTVGKVCLAGMPMAMNQSCFALSSKIIDPLLVYFYTISSINSLKSKANGSVFDAITISEFETEYFHRLVEAEEVNFVKFARPVFDMILLITNEIRNLTSLRDALLPKLMSGEIDVSNVKI